LGSEVNLAPEAPGAILREKADRGPVAGPGYIIKLGINKGIVCLLLMGRGDFSRPYPGRLKPPLPETKAPKSSHYFSEAH